MNRLLLYSLMINMCTPQSLHSVDFMVSSFSAQTVAFIGALSVSALMTKNAIECYSVLQKTKNDINTFVTSDSIDSLITKVLDLKDYDSPDDYKDRIKETLKKGLFNDAQKQIVTHYCQIGALGFFTKRYTSFFMPTEFDYKTNFTRIFSIRGGCCGHALTIQSSYYSCPDKITRACFFNFTDTGGVLLSGPVVFYRKVIQSQLKTSSRSDAFSDLNFENQKLLWKTINDLPSSDDLHKHLLLKHLQEGVAHDRLSYEKPAIKRSVFVDTSNVKK